MDFAVVGKQGIHHRTQPLQGILVLVSDGFIAKVATGHDKRATNF
jgi:hypothetical protein